MSTPEFRPGGKQPGNIYRDNQRFAFCVRNHDGPMVAAALNAYTARRDRQVDLAVIAELARIAHAANATQITANDAWYAGRDFVLGLIRNRLRELGPGDAQ